jgi:hypothetical protein
MKQYFLSCLFLLLTNVAIAQASWDWATVPAMTGTGSSAALGSVTDAAGNVYVTGYFYSSTITFGTYTLTKAASSSTATTAQNDCFVVKYDPAGNVIWAISAGGAGTDAGYGIAIDLTGAIYVTGYFGSSAINFGAVSIQGSGTSNDVFIVKLDANGTAIWGSSGVGSGSDKATSVTTDGLGNAYLCGDYNSPSLSFGGQTIVNNSGTTQLQLFVAKYSPAGTVDWLSTPTGGFMAGAAIRADASDNVFVTGTFSGTPSVGSVSFSNAAGLGAYVLKYLPSGLTDWGRSASGGYAHGLATDNNGNVYIAGHFYGGSLSFSGTTINNAATNGNFANAANSFLTKYSPTGTVLWAISAGGLDDDMGTAVAVDAVGNIVLVGFFRSASVVIGSTTLSNSGSGFMDIFAAKYNPSGVPQWALSAGGAPDNDNVFGLSTDLNGNTYLSGFLNGPSSTFGNMTVTKAAGQGAFTARIAPPCAAAPVITQSALTLTTAAGQGSYQWYKNGLAITAATSNSYNATANGSYYVVVVNASNCAVQSNAISITSLKGPKKREIAAVQAVKVYPNPNSGVFNIQFPAGEVSATVTVTNTLGAVVKKETITATLGTVSLEIPGKVPGVYFLEVKTADEIVQTKILVQ